MLGLELNKQFLKLRKRQEENERQFGLFTDAMRDGLLKNSPTAEFLSKSLDYRENPEDYLDLDEARRNALAGTYERYGEKKTLDMLPKAEVIAFLSDIEFSKESTLQSTYKVAKAHGLEEKEVESLITRKFLSVPPVELSKSLNELPSHRVYSFNELVSVTKKNNISDKKLHRMRRDGHIDFLKPSEARFLDAVKDKPYHMQDQMFFEIAKDRGVDSDSLLHLFNTSKLDLIEPSDMRGLKEVCASSRGDIEKALRLTEKMCKEGSVTGKFSKIKKRFYLDEDKNVRFNLNVLVDYSTRANKDVKVRYKEPSSVTALREKKTTTAVLKGEHLEHYVKYAEGRISGARGLARAEIIKNTLEGGAKFDYDGISPSIKDKILSCLHYPQYQNWSTKKSIDIIRSVGPLIKESENHVGLGKFNNKNEAYFTQALKRRRPALSEIRHLMSDYQMDEKTIVSLKERGVIDFMTPAELSYALSYKKSASSVPMSIISDLSKRGFVKTQERAKAVSFLRGKELTKEYLLDNSAKLFPSLSLYQVQTLINDGTIDVLDSNERMWLLSGASKDTLADYGIQDSRYSYLKKRIKRTTVSKVASIDERALSINERNYVRKLAEGMDKSEQSSLIRECGLTGERAGSLESRIKRTADVEVRTDSSIKINPAIKVENKVKVLTSLGLVGLKESRTLSSNAIPSLEPWDKLILLKGEVLGEEGLSKIELARYYEIKDMEIPCRNKLLPSQNEINFFNKIRGRKVSLENIIKIANDDFMIGEMDVQDFIESKVITVGKTGDEGASVNWSEFEELQNARVYVSTELRHGNKEAKRIFKELSLEIPDSLLLNEIRSVEEFDFREIGFLPDGTISGNEKLKMSDYNLIFKAYSKKELNNFEENRLQFLRQNGIHPESQSMVEHLRETPGSWKLKSLFKQRHVGIFLENYEVDPFVFEFTNCFKQVTEKQLGKLGLEPKKLNMLTMGLPEDDLLLGGSRMFVRDWFKTPRGNVVHYSLQHEGLLSGRAVVEQRILKKDVTKKPQGRLDLLHHDLKVVDCVLEVINEYAEKGYEVVGIENEATQMSREKFEKSNEARGNVCFMDARIKFALKSEIEQGNAKVLEVAVEYGNYELNRMQSKISNTKFDSAYVYSKDTYCNKYEKGITTNGDVKFRSI